MRKYALLEYNHNIEGVEGVAIMLPSTESGMEFRTGKIRIQKCFRELIRECSMHGNGKKTNFYG